MLQKELEKTLAHYTDPYVEKSFGESKAVKSVCIEEGKVTIGVQLGYPCAIYKSSIAAALKGLLNPLITDKKIQIDVTSQIDAHVGKPGIKGLSFAKNIIAVGSGKGGVGKSTVAVNIALALAREGAQVGLLDADIYGPSQPAMLGLQGKRPEIKGRLLTPIKCQGIQSMSIGYLIDQNAPMVWRGPMLGKALQQLLQDTQWQNLDYLIIDLPPGTGDVQLTLCQKIPLTGALIVTTPQDMALLDVKRACEMFNKLQVPILGVVENMSIHHCPNCGHEQSIFGEGGGERLAKEYRLPFFGGIPLAVKIREMTDSGSPPAGAEDENPFREVFFEIARKVAAKISLFPKDYSALFPKISMERASRTAQDA